MKNILTTISILISLLTYSQTPTIVGMGTGSSLEDLPSGSYIKDLNNEFEKFSGTWRWSSGSETLTFILEKKENQLDDRYGSFRDYMIGNYVYYNANSNVSINTSLNFYDLTEGNPPLYTSGIKDSESIEFMFIDVLIQKKYTANALFKFEPGSLTQLKLQLKNPGTIGLLPGETFNSNFSIPNNVILTKIE